MTGPKQEHLTRIIEFLKELSERSGTKGKKDHNGKSLSLFEELSGYSWKYCGEEWVRTLELIHARYQHESRRVRAIQSRRRR